ncbi:MAG: SpoIIE family protein phosphatase [Thermoleophilaceae bacterium]|nr:SpoIIE family protein phosphatase [Thermoleophilaceae bacterium]
MGLALLLTVLIALADVIVGGSAVLAGLLIAGPLVAALRLDARATALVGAVALSLALFVGIPDMDFATVNHLSRVATVIVGSALAIFVARTRFQREEAANFLKAQHAVAQILAETETLAEATPRLLPAMAPPLGWEGGTIWEVDRRRGEVAPMQTWTAESADLVEFEKATRTRRMARGQGLPGSVWERGETCWIEDVQQDEMFARKPAALESGVVTAAGFPILGHGGVLGVIEVYSRERRESDHEMIGMMATFGRQIGQFIERKQADLAVRESESMKGAILAGALDAVVTMDHAGRVSEFNPAAERIFGYSAAEAIGADLAGLIIPPEMREAHHTGLERALRTGEGEVFGRRLELTGMRKDGGQFPVELTVTWIEGTEPPLFSGQIRDITPRMRSESDLRRSRDQLEIILQGVADGVTAQDTTGRLVFANAAAVRVLGYDEPEELMAAAPEEIMERFQIFTPDGEPFAPADLPGRHALAGEEPPDVTLRFRVLATGEERWSVVKARPIFDSAGTVLMAINIFEDVTDQMRREASQRFLAESSKLLAGSLDYETTLRQVASLTVPRLADWCSVELLDEHGELQSVALEHQDPRRVKWAQELRERYPVDMSQPTGTPHVLRTGQAELYSEIPDELLRASARDEEHYRLLHDLGMRSAMIVPVDSPEGVLGTISLVGEERRFDQDDLSLACEVAHRAGLAVANARLYSERAHIARTLQESLLPPRLPSIPNVDTAARFRAAGAGNEVGGDFYDLFDLGEGSGWAVVIGDVCGKGPEAAAITALARYTLRAAAMQTKSPSDALGILNEAMLSQHSDKRFCSVAFTSLSGAAMDGGGALDACVASGGHPLPLVLRAEGGVEEAGEHGTLIGVVPDPDLCNRPIQLAPGDAIVMFTDGVTEVRRDEREVFGPRHLVELLGQQAGRDAGEIADTIETRVVEAWGGEPRDDIAILVLRVCP